MKKYVALMLLGCLLLTGCEAEKVNKAVEAVGDAAGFNIDSNISQDQINKIEEGLENAVNVAVDLVNDENLQDSIKEFTGNIAGDVAGDIKSNISSDLIQSLTE